MKNLNYYTCFGWMFNELKLNGNDVHVFALILSFSKDGETRFTGSLSYISNALNLSKRSVINILKKLESKKFIIKQQLIKNNQSYNSYYVPSELFSLAGEKSLKGGEKSSYMGGEKSSHNNNNKYNNIESDTRASDFLKKEYEIRFNIWELKNKNQLDDYQKFLHDYNDTVDIEGLNYTGKILFSRLDKFFRNWIQIQNRPIKVVNEDNFGPDRPELRRIG